MIQIFGESGDAEHEAARQLGALIHSAWGQRLSDQRQKVALKTAAKCHGQDVRDIDVLLMIALKQPLEVTIPLAEDIQLPSSVYVKSLLAAIEVKDHPPGRIRFTNNAEVEVLYSNGWKNASRQSNSQNIALRNYLSCVGIDNLPYVVNVIWLRGVPHGDLPRPPHNVVGADATWELIVRACMSQIRAWYQDGFHLVKAETTPGVITRIRRLFTDSLRPSLLDRRKLEAICRETAVDFLSDVDPGDKQLILRGRGGTGKTIGLLTFAFEQYVQQNARSLILTYNVALAAELERLLTILHVRDSADGRTIHVDTVHAFLRRVFISVGLLDENDDFLEVYRDRKSALLEYLEDKELHAAIRSESDAGMYDFVCVDEAQDFPEDERDIIHRLFGVVNCLVADGVDQLVRPSSICDWRHVPEVKGATRTVALRVSLRMQSNLCEFANTFASQMGLPDWRIDPNPRIPGGRVIISNGPGFLDETLYDELAKENCDAGNAPIDMLFCVPHTLVEKNCSEAPCIPGRSFVECGRRVWDGTRRDVRKIPALDNSLHRFVQYESCRGLEGWITFLYRLDEFLEYKTWFFEQQETEDDVESIAARKAAEWLMIPLTRCINTLVINIAKPTSKAGLILERVGRELIDFVEFRQHR